MKVLDWVLGKTINYPSGSLHLGVLGIGYWVLGIGYWVLGIGYRHKLVRGGGRVLCLSHFHSKRSSNTSTCVP